MARFDPVELEELKARTALSSVFERYGVKSRGSRRARWAVCCFHGEKTGSLKIDDERGTFHCFGCGQSGDHFAVIMELGGKTFPEAVEALGGIRFVTVEERQAIEERQRKWREEEEDERKRTRTASEKLFASGKKVIGTHAEAYLTARGLPVAKQWTTDLRFIPDLAYRGFPTAEADEETNLASVPAMVAAIRDHGGAIIGLHRTYLDPKEPKKLDPPGDLRRNKAKKVMGEMRGGMIRLSPPARLLAMGEGIETSRAWYALGYGGDDDVAVAAAVSLGNMSGGAAGSAEHPADPTKRIPNGIPDMDRPGVILPREVEGVILLGDGDSDPHMTRARLLVAVRRFRAMGRLVQVHMAPNSADWNDVLTSTDAVEDTAA